MAVQNEKYASFVQEQAKRLGSLNLENAALIWHYTDGAGLIGILESGTIYSTQVSCLNDSTEIRYAQVLFQKALTDSVANYQGNENVRRFGVRYLKLMEGNPSIPSHAPSKFFVSCFSREEDNLSQWRAYGGGENGYAIAFKVENLFCVPNVMLKVNYDKEIHEQLSTIVANTTLQYYEEELQGKNADEVTKWEDEFLVQWDSAISYLAPLVKDPGFRAEICEVRTEEDDDDSSCSPLFYRWRSGGAEAAD